MRIYYLYPTQCDILLTISIVLSANNILENKFYKRMYDTIGKKIEVQLVVLFKIFIYIFDNCQVVSLLRLEDLNIV
jgi:hypothetical protein